MVYQYSLMRSGALKHASTTQATTAAEVDGKPFGWILGPAIDLLFCCGGLLWILVFAYQWLAKDNTSHGSAVQTFVLVAIMGAHLLNESHTSATLVRVYASAETRRQFAMYTIWWAIICALAGVAALFANVLAPLLLKLYFLTVPFHFTGQSYGIALLYCYKRRYPISHFEKVILKRLFQCTALYAVLRQLTDREWGAEMVLGLQLPFWGPLPTWCITIDVVFILVLSAILITSLVCKFVRSRDILPLPACMLIATGMLIFLVPKSFNSVLWLFVPAFFHGSQYLVVSLSYYLKERGLQGVPPAEIGSLLTRPPALIYLGTVFLIGTFIYVALPHMLEECGFNLIAATAAVFAAINLHHFVTDAGIWRLRDANVRRILVQ